MEEPRIRKSVSRLRNRTQLRPVSATTAGMLSEFRQPVCVRLSAGCTFDLADRFATSGGTMSSCRPHGLVLLAGTALGLVLPLAAPAEASTSSTPGADDRTAIDSASSPAWKRPFKGIRYFYVPSQQRYRAVKFSPKSYVGLPTGFLAWAFSSGKKGDSCFNGRRTGNAYYGKVYVIRTDRSYRAVYNLDDLTFGRPTKSAPSWFKNRARSHHNSTGFCSFGFAWPSW